MAEPQADGPQTQINGELLKSISQVLLERRAIPNFTDEPVPDEYLRAILGSGLQAPSGYNLQPWRFLVLRELQNRKQLQTIAFGQLKIAEAPVVIVAFGMTE